MKNILHASIIALSLLALGSVSRLQAQALGSGNIVFMRVQGGAVQGDILGEVTQKGREGSHTILAFSHEVISPRDLATGMATGKRQHQPFRVVKYLNKGTPLLTKAFAAGETFAAITIDIWTPTATGAELKLISYTLKKASIVSVRPWMPNKQDSAAAAYTTAEEIAFVYQTLTVTYPNEGIETTIQWGE